MWGKKLFWGVVLNMLLWLVTWLVLTFRGKRSKRSERSLGGGGGAKIDTQPVDFAVVKDPIERGLLELIALGSRGQFIDVIIEGRTSEESRMMQFGAPVKHGKGEGFALLVNLSSSETSLRMRTSEFLKQLGFEPWGEEDSGIHAYTPVDAKASAKIGRDIIEEVFELPRDVKVDVKVY